MIHSRWDNKRPITIRLHYFIIKKLIVLEQCSKIYNVQPNLLKIHMHAVCPFLTSQKLRNVSKILLIWIRCWTPHCVAVRSGAVRVATNGFPCCLPCWRVFLPALTAHRETDCFCALPAPPTDRQTEGRHIGRKINRRKTEGGQAGGQAGKQTNRQTAEQLGGQTDRQASRQAGAPGRHTRKRAERTTYRPTGS